MKNKLKHLNENSGQTGCVQVRQQNVLNYSANNYPKIMAENHLLRKLVINLKFCTDNSTNNSTKNLSVTKHPNSPKITRTNQLNKL